MQVHLAIFREPPSACKSFPMKPDLIEVQGLGLNSLTYLSVFNWPPITFSEISFNLVIPRTILLKLTLDSPTSPNPRKPGGPPTGPAIFSRLAFSISPASAPTQFKSLSLPRNKLRYHERTLNLFAEGALHSRNAPRLEPPRLWVTQVTQQHTAPTGLLQHG